MHRRWRRLRWGAGTFVVLVAALLLAMPAWLPWLLGPAVKRYGIHYQAFHRQGYARFEVRNLTFTNAAIRLEVRRLQALTPPAWLWRRLQSNLQEPYAQVEGWKLSLGPARPPAPSRGPASVDATYRRVERVVGTLFAWTPKAAVADGAIVIQDHTLGVPSSVLDRGRVVTRFIPPQSSHEADAVFVWGNPSSGHTLEIKDPSLELRSTFTSTSGPAGLEVRGTILLLTNRLELTAFFDPAAHWPTRARLKGGALAFPADRLNVPDYQDVRGSLLASWETNRFAFDLIAAARPQTNHAELPPLETRIQALGDTHRAWIESARISAPWLRAQLSRPVEIRFASPYLAGPVTATLDSDLAGQSWLAARGRLAGQIHLTPTAGKYPAAAFSLSGAGVGFPVPAALAPPAPSGAVRPAEEVALKSFEVSGRFDWPWLEVAKAEVRLADGSSASGLGRLDLEHATADAVRVRCEGAFGRTWLPPGLSYEQARFSAELSGPWTNLAHSGAMEGDGFRAPRLNPVRLSARWQGRQWRLTELNVSAAASNSVLTAAGALDWGATNCQVQLRTLTMAKEGQPVLQLAQPASFRLAPQGSHTLSIQLDSFDWGGGTTAVHVAGEAAWPNQGRVSATIRQLDLRLFSDFVPLPVAQASVPLLDLAAGWDRGPVALQLGLGVELALGKTDLPVSAAVQLSSGAEGASIEKLVLATHGQPGLTARGFLPVVVQSPASNHILRVNPSQRLSVSARSQPNPFVWDQVARWTGLGLREPEVKMNLSGTLEAPRGEISLAAAQLNLLRAGRPLPPLQDLFAQVELDGDKAHLSQFRVRVAGRPVTASADLPLGKAFWSGLAERDFKLDWKQAAARLTVPPAELAALADFLPAPLMPQGEISAQVILEPGGVLRGEIGLTGARTLPLAELGPVRDIQARVVFHGRRVELQKISAEIGGQTVQADGAMELPPEFWPQRGLPAATVHLRGNGVPLARRPDLILRADLDLVLTNAAGQWPTVAGDIRLRDSFLLSDLKDLMPGKLASPRQRPPYFSIEAEPLADWRLNLRVQGQQFMKVRSTFFRGAVSVTLKLEGTLKDPIALGDAQLSAGEVRFPFASFEVTQGMVTLTSDDPYHPQLLVNARTKRAGYDLKLEVTGPADAPVLQFSSSPPLSQDEVMMMVTAGQMPTEGLRLSTTQRAQTVALFVGRDVLAELGFGSAHENRLTVTTGAGVTLQGGPTYEIEYKLNRDWSIVGEYDRFNQYIGGLKWRIYSK